MNVPTPPAELHVWLDPSCPWAWQTFLWLRDLEQQGVLRLSYGLFSLEVNATERPTTFAEAATRYGDALAALAAAADPRGAARRLCVRGCEDGEARAAEDPPLARGFL